MWPRWFRWLAGVVVVAFALAVAWVATGRRAPGNQLRLPDGTLLTVRHLGVGPDFNWRPRGQLASRFERFVPARLQPLLGPPNPSPVTTSQRSGLFVWLTRVDPGTHEPAADDGLVQGVEILDSHGCQFRSHGGGSSTLMSGDRQMQVFHYDLSSFPRREPHLTLRMLGASNRLMGVIRVRNPAFARVREWVAKPPPLSIETNGLTVVLKCLQQVPDEDPPMLSATIEVLRDGGPARDWEVRYWTWADATGNDGYYVCRYEPALMIRASLYPRARGTSVEREIEPIGVDFLVAPPAQSTEAPVRR